MYHTPFPLLFLIVPEKSRYFSCAEAAGNGALTLSATSATGKETITSFDSTASATGAVDDADDVGTMDSCGTFGAEGTRSSLLRRFAVPSAAPFSLVQGFQGNKGSLSPVLDRKYAE